MDCKPLSPLYLKMSQQKIRKRCATMVYRILPAEKWKRVCLVIRLKQKYPRVIAARQYRISVKKIKGSSIPRYSRAKAIMSNFVLVFRGIFCLAEWMPKLVYG